MTNRRILLGALLISPVATRSIIAGAQSPVASPSIGLSEALDALLTDQSFDPPFSGTALITSGGVPVLDAAYGLADGIANQPNTIDTAFQIASITKTLTAALIMQLRDERAFALDDSASTLLPQFAGQLDSRSEPVTIRQLLMHTAGVPDFLELYDLLDVASHPETLEQLLERVASEPLKFEPGTNFHYSNSGYLYLGRIVVAVTGHSWEATLTERIIDPLELDRTWLTPPDDRAPVATGYLNVEGLVLPVSRFSRIDLAESAGGLTSTTHDLQGWLDAFMTGEIVSLDTVAEMLDPGLYEYGLGWSTNEFAGRLWQGHFGEAIGFRTVMLHNSELDASIILLSNRQDFPMYLLAGAIANLIANA